MTEERRELRQLRCSYSVQIRFRFSHLFGSVNFPKVCRLSCRMIEEERERDRDRDGYSLEYSNCKHHGYVVKMCN